MSNREKIKQRISNVLTKRSFHQGRSEHLFALKEILNLTKTANEPLISTSLLRQQV